MLMPVLGGAGWMPLAVPAYIAALAAGPAPWRICGAVVDPADAAGGMALAARYDTSGGAASEIESARSLGCVGCLGPGGEAIADLLAAHAEALMEANPSVHLLEPMKPPVATPRAERRRAEKAARKVGGRPSGAARHHDRAGVVLRHRRPDAVAAAPRLPALQRSRRRVGCGDGSGAGDPP
jgi:hypothetical protein